MTIAGFNIPTRGPWVFPSVLTHREVAAIPITFWQKCPSQGQWQIDLSAVKEIDSAFLALLLAIWRKAAVNGLNLKIKGLNANAKSLLEVYGMSTLFEKHIL